MKYYLHDTGAFEDEKVCELFMHFGYEGLGLFYTILEKLAKQEKPIKTTVLKSQLKVGKRLEKCWNFMESLGIISSNNGDTFNKQLLNYAEKYKIKKEKNAKKISEWREKQDDTKTVTGYEPTCNHPKVKESKVKESKVTYKEYVTLTQSEYNTLISELGEELTSLSIEKLNAYKGSTGKKYKSDYLAMKNWVVNQVIVDQKNRTNGGQGQTAGKRPATSEQQVINIVHAAFAAGNIPV